MSDAIYVMLLTHPKFAQFTEKSIVDSRNAAEVIVAPGVDNKDGVAGLWIPVPALVPGSRRHCWEMA